MGPDSRAPPRIKLGVHPPGDQVNSRGFKHFHTLVFSICEEKYLPNTKKDPYKWFSCVHSITPALQKLLPFTTYVSFNHVLPSLELSHLFFPDPSKFYLTHPARFNRLQTRASPDLPCSPPLIPLGQGREGKRKDNTRSFTLLYTVLTMSISFYLTISLSRHRSFSL